MISRLTKLHDFKYKIDIYKETNLYDYCLGGVGPSLDTSFVATSV